MMFFITTFREVWKGKIKELKEDRRKDSLQDPKEECTAGTGLRRRKLRSRKNP